jgi:polyphosphate kinase
MTTAPMTAPTTGSAKSGGVQPARPDPALFLNRELSFLEYNQRVLEEAADPAVPLLERLRFAALVGANLDELFMVRVAGLRQQQRGGVRTPGADGLRPVDVLAAVLARVSRQVEDLEGVLLGAVLPALAAEGVGVLRVAELGDAARAELARRFERQVFPMLTPLAVDPGHPFPFLKNLTLNLAVHLLPERSPEDVEPLLAVVQVPPMLDRIVPVEAPGDLSSPRTSPPSSRACVSTSACPSG